MATKEPTSPTRFSVGDRTYEFAPLLERGDRYLNDYAVVERAMQRQGDLSAEDFGLVEAHHDKIPQELRGKWLVLTLTDIRHRHNFPSALWRVTILTWNDGRWNQHKEHWSGLITRDKEHLYLRPAA